MRDNIHLINRGVDFCPGLCALIRTLEMRGTVTFLEKEAMLKYLTENAPKNFEPRQTKFIGHYYSNFWFTPFAKPPRMRWLTLEIEKFVK